MKLELLQMPQKEMSELKHPMLEVSTYYLFRMYGVSKKLKEYNFDYNKLKKK